MIRGGWSFRLAPRDDELLSSLLVRNAHAHGIGPYAFTNLFWPNRPVWNRDVDRCADTAWLADLADRLETPLVRVRATTVVDVERALGPAAAGRPGTIPLLLAAGVYHRVRRRHGLQFCPRCLAAHEHPHFVRDWRVAFALTCAVHGCRLFDACPRCDMPVMPHRTAVGFAGHCQRCALPLATASHGAGVMPSPAVARLESGLFALLHAGRSESPVGPWWTADAFPGVRALLAIASAPWLVASVREELGLSPAPPAGAETGQFEHARWPWRLALMEVVAALLEDWPHRFHHVAGRCGITQRTFARIASPPMLAAEVEQLPEGGRRQRKSVAVLSDPALRRLRRRDPAAYRNLRAQRLLAVCGRPDADGTIAGDRS